jgi:acetylornithine deacetylase
VEERYVDGTLPAAVDRAIERGAEECFDFLERLVREDSQLGREQSAQELVAAELSSLGLRVQEIAIPPEIVDDPLAGVGQIGYEGRCNLLAVTSEEPLELLFNGHIDVVSAPPQGWRRPPFAPHREDGWLIGRGAGDMKGGFAAAMLALRALRAAAPQVLQIPLGFLSVLEEECTGNGTLAAVRAGISAEAVILPESTDLRILLGGVGVVWVDVVLDGQGAHAESSGRSPGVLDAVGKVTCALRRLGRDANEHREADFASLSDPYAVNIGILQAGDWHSNVPSRATLGVRFGHPRAWSADEALAALGDAVRDACQGSGVTAGIVPAGLRAEGYCEPLDSALIHELSVAHERSHGSPCETYVIGSTTDARFYVNRGIPAVCYGPAARDIHGPNERVELASIVRSARTFATLLLRRAGGSASSEPRERPSHV